MEKQVDILIVDDQRINLILLKGILKPLKLNVVEATSGAEAIKAIEGHDFALILLDVMMPGMDGFETAEKLRSQANSKHIPIIFITAISKDQRNIFKGYEIGAVDYLIKPVENEILLSKVKVFIDLHHQKKALTYANAKLERSISSLNKFKEALLQSEERYRIIADYAFHWENWFGPDDEMLYVSLSSERITGYPPEKFMEDARFIEKLIHKDDLPHWLQYMADKSQIEKGSIDFRFFRKDGLMRWLTQVSRVVRGKNGEYLGTRCSISDITSRKQLEIQLKYQALHDPLTGLANRTRCLDHIAQAQERSRQRKNYNYALLFLNLDRFKVINDSLGHKFGDKLLVRIGERLLRCVRSLDTVSRYGGDEFVILLEELASHREAIQVVKRIRKELTEEFDVDDLDIQTSASIGIVLSPPQTLQPEDLLRNANLAMHRAKELGRNRFKVFTTRLLDQAVRLLTIENDLRHALSNNEFYLVYQPILSLDNLQLVGFEALVRWNHPQKGLIRPNEFIPVAEDTGLIIEMGLWILEEACKTMAFWHETFSMGSELMISVNVSGKQFSQSDLVEQVKRILEKTKLPSEHLRLEITETTIMEHADSAIDKLHRLKRLGVTLGIDDFGTGYSSMSYLQRFPVDLLKIDLSFVQQMTTSHENLEIVKGIISLAHSLKLGVVAEGVETRKQQDLLCTLNCEYAQGFLYSRPLAEKEAGQYIALFSTRNEECLEP